jgi:hypothetical protein
MSSAHLLEFIYSNDGKRVSIFTSLFLNQLVHNPRGTQVLGCLNAKGNPSVGCFFFINDLPQSKAFSSEGGSLLDAIRLQDMTLGSRVRRPWITWEVYVLFNLYQCWACIKHWSKTNSLFS